MKKKNNVILDLDNTIISAEALEDFPMNDKDVKEKINKFTYHNMDGYYIVFERPHLQDFLDWLFENYNVAVWTAATKDYALFIVDKILMKKPNRKLDFIFFSYHCDLSKYFYKNEEKRFSKKLLLITEDFQIRNYYNHNTLIIDDLPDVSQCQPDMAIRIHPFEFLDKNSEKDNVLLDIKKKIMKRLPLN